MKITIVRATFYKVNGNTSMSIFFKIFFTGI